MDPSRIYGYISLVDPNTGQKHLPVIGNPPILQGYPETLLVSFKSLMDGLIVNVSFRMGEGLNVIGLVNNPYVAYRYNFGLMQNTGLSGAPAKASNANGWFIQYNPNQYQFQTVQLNQYIYPDPNGTLLYGTIKMTGIPLTTRAVPFTEFPNIA